MSEQRFHSSWTFAIGVIVLLICISAGVIAFVPMAACPDADLAEDEHFSQVLNSQEMRQHRAIRHYAAECQICGGTAKVTLYRKWTYRPPWIVIGTFDYRRVSDVQIISVLKKSGIEGASGPGSIVYQFLVPKDKAKAAIEVLQKSNLAGLNLYELGTNMK